MRKAMLWRWFDTANKFKKDKWVFIELSKLMIESPIIEIIKAN